VRGGAEEGWLGPGGQVRLKVETTRLACI
jgi:hypothetical protein